MIHHHLMYSNWVSECMYYRLPDNIGSVGVRSDIVCVRMPVKPAGDFEMT